MTGTRVSDREGLRAAVGRGLAEGRPFLVDVLIDTSPNAWAYPAFQPFRPEDAEEQADGEAGSGGATAI